MDYQFSFDALNRPKARCSMDHEAFADWLTHDLGNNHQHISDILTQVDRLLGKQISRWQQSWADYRLILTQEDAIVSSARMNHSLDDSMQQDGLSDDEDYLFGGDGLLGDGLGIDPDELSLDEQQGHAMCGLEDFQALIFAWQAFIETR